VRKLLSNKYILLFLSCFCVQTSFAQCELEIHIKGLQNNKGSVGVRLYQTAADYKNDNVYKEYKIAPKNLQASLTIRNVPKGNYSISVAHDENLNKKFDKNILGIPTESFGFSNNPKIYFGPPSFDQIRFKLDDKSKIMNIRLIQLL